MVFFQPRGLGVIRCDKEWQGMTRGDKKLGAWELILKLPNESGFFSIQADKVW